MPFYFELSIIHIVRYLSIKQLHSRRQNKGGEKKNWIIMFIVKERMLFFTEQVLVTLISHTKRSSDKWFACAVVLVISHVAHHMHIAHCTNHTIHTLCITYTTCITTHIHASHRTPTLHARTQAQAHTCTQPGKSMNAQNDSHTWK